jgi:hypothetical protein
MSPNRVPHARGVSLDSTEHGLPNVPALSPFYWGSSAVNQILAWAAAGVAVVAAAFWIISTTVSVAAPVGTKAEGALSNGHLIARNRWGNRIDPSATLQRQAHWNKRAAIVTAASSVLVALALAV